MIALLLAGTGSLSEFLNVVLSEEDASPFSYLLSTDILISAGITCRHSYSVNSQGLTVPKRMWLHPPTNFQTASVVTRHPAPLQESTNEGTC